MTSIVAILAVAASVILGCITSAAIMIGLFSKSAETFITARWGEEAWKRADWWAGVVIWSTVVFLAMRAVRGENAAAFWRGLTGGG